MYLYAFTSVTSILTVNFACIAYATSVVYSSFEINKYMHVILLNPSVNTVSF